MLFDQMHFDAAEGSFRQWFGNLACDSLVSVLQKAVESTMEGLVTMSGKRHATELAIGSKTDFIEHIEPAFVNCACQRFQARTLLDNLAVGRHVRG